MTMEWLRLGSPAPTALVDARIQLHWAAQVIAAVADRWIAPQADDSHTNMEWRRDPRALVGHATATGSRIGLRLADATLLYVGEGERVGATLRLEGKTLAEALAWADARVAQAAGERPHGIAARDYDMPAHAVSAGAAFSPAGAAHEELSRWVADADRLLREVAAAEPHATPIRCWPHHFDIGGIAYLGADAAPTAPQIGFGLSPGDGYYAEPYFYVTPHPIRESARFPALAGRGHWRTTGFVGAILTGSAVVASGDQLAGAKDFFASALAAARAVIPHE